MAKSPDNARTALPQMISIVAIAFLLRVIVAILMMKSHSTGWFFEQTTELGRLAESLRTGHGLSSPFGGDTGPSAFLSPGYPMLVAAVFAIFGSYSSASEATMMTLQVFFGTLTVLLVMRLTQRIFGARTATVTGLIAALCPPAIFLPTLFWETSLSVLLATALFAVSYDCAQSPRNLNWIALGLFAAIALLVNPSLLPIILCCFVWSAYRTYSHALPAVTLGILLFIALSTPWAVRNLHQLHAFIPMRSNLGYELWQGNRPGSDGFFLANLHPNVNAAEFQQYEQLGEVGYMHEKLLLAKIQIAANPSWFAELTAKRIYYFWLGIGRQSSALVVAYIAGTSLLGFGGLVLLWRRNQSLGAYFLFPLMLFPLPYYITHPDYRFRLVIDPIMAALAAYTLTSRTRDLSPETTQGS